MEILIGAILGTIGSLVVAHFYYGRATIDLTQQIDRLKQATVDLQRTRNELEFRDTFDFTMSARQTFWETLRRAYEQWKPDHPDAPTMIEELIDLAPPAQGLPLDPSDHLKVWAAKEPNSWEGFARLLWEFASEIYPAREPETSTLPDSQVLSSDDFQPFHEARGKLAKFFNRLGKAALDSQDVSVGVVDEILVTHVRLCKVLSYLEGNFVLRTTDDGPGKSWLFKLQHWTSNDQSAGLVRSNATTQGV